MQKQYGETLLLLWKYLRAGTEERLQRSHAAQPTALRPRICVGP